MRVLHFSDIHLPAPLPLAPLGQWFGKRVIGGLNLLLRRRAHYADGSRKLEQLDRLRRAEQVDLVICTGDYTSLGLDTEFAAARAAVQPLMGAPLGYVNVPGNHDLYARDVLRERRFERYFGDTLHTDLPEYRRDGPWPLLRMVGEACGVAAVNSARPNPPPWRSSGRIPGPQLAGLREALHDERLRERFIFIVTHYAPRLASGRPDRRLHGLVNANELLDVAAGVGRGAILCGHVHHPFHVRLGGGRPALFCAGSTTLEGREGLWLFDIGRAAAQARQGRWEGGRWALGEPIPV